MLCGRKGWKKVESRSWAPAGSARSLAPGKQAWPAPNLPPGKGVKSGLAFPGLFWYNHKESGEPLPGAAEFAPEWQPEDKLPQCGKSGGVLLCAWGPPADNIDTHGTDLECPAAAGGTGRRTGMRAVVFRTKGGVASYPIPRAQCSRKRPGKTFVNFFLSPVSLHVIML